MIETRRRENKFVWFDCLKWSFSLCVLPRIISFVELIYSLFIILYCIRLCAHNLWVLSLCCIWPAAVQCTDLFSRLVCGCRDGCYLSLSAIDLRILGSCADWWNPLGGGVSSRRQPQGHAQPGATPEGVWAVCWQWVTVGSSWNTVCLMV